MDEALEASQSTALVEWLAAFELHDVPDSVRERAAHLILDGIGCALVGAQLPWSRVAVNALQMLDDGDSTTLIGWDRRVGPLSAVTLNSTFIQGFELDDFHPFAPVHSASLVVPSLLAAAELNPALSGADVLRGAIAGFEVGPRIGRALHGSEMLDRGWHSGAVFGGPAAAAAVTVAQRAEADVIEDALGIAATQAGGLMAAQFEAMSKRMQHGFAARNGFTAAILASGGYTGIKRVFERGYGGYLSTFGEGHDPRPRELAAELGERWETDHIIVKQFATMGGLQGPVDAALALRDQLRPDDTIDRVDVWVGSTVYRHGWWVPERPLTPVGAQMNVGYAIAAALRDGPVLPEQYTDDRLDADDIWELISRTRVHHDEAFDRGGPATRHATHLAITTGDGRKLETHVAQPRGGPQNPTTNPQIVEKFRALTDRVMDRQRADRILAHVLDLERQDSLGALLGALAPNVNGALS